MFYCFFGVFFLRCQDDGDVAVVRVVRPRHQRTPEIITLTDSDAAEEEEEEEVPEALPEASPEASPEAQPQATVRRTELR